MRELQSYEAAWKVYLNAVVTRKERILNDSKSKALAATFLREPALDAWDRRLETLVPRLDI